MIDSFDDVTDLIDETLINQESYLELQDVLASMSEQAEGRAELLNALGEQAERLGYPDRAIEWFGEAWTNGGPTTIDPRAGLLSATLKAGHDDIADELLGELRRSSAAGTFQGDDFHLHVAAALEEAGRFKQAERWCNIGLLSFDEELDDPSSYPWWSLLCGRSRVRKLLGRPTDQFDLLVEQSRPQPA